ncbi:MAG TPA: chemotaxis response regulator protein-glutamate methylesterase [Terriglobales bacterium]|jgi:two-component system chemotaxis response regulator CheB|nr:chemotaxis response regulator protein-glutamate methylesterase [Terriglobales bacterium]
MKPVRVLIVDDSAVIRRLLSNLLATDPEIVVVGTAGNGVQALGRIPEAKPDLITLDIEMPGMNGLETLVEIRKLYPKLPVIMFSTLTERGATATLDALAKGASDYVTKPTHSGGSESARELVRDELIRKIKSLCAVAAPRSKTPAAPPRRTDHPQSRIDLVAIGTSTGGPNALTALIPQLPADFPVPIVIVQHMPPLFTRLLAERLHALSRLEVREGKEGEKLRRGQVWIAPGDYHMTVARKGAEFVLGLNHDSQENSCRPAVDVLFRSVARAFGANVLAVVLTGMGADGTRGSSEIREAGGEVFVQDEASSVVWGMPGSIVAASLADHIYPLTGMAPQVVRRVWMRRALASAAPS